MLLPAAAAALAASAAAGGCRRVGGARVRLRLHAGREEDVGGDGHALECGLVGAARLGGDREPFADCGAD